MSLIIKKAPEVDLRAKSPLFFDISLALSLLIITGLFAFSRGELDEKKVIDDIDEKVEIIEIPPTKQLTRPPPPARPSIPVEAEDEDEIDEITIDDTEVDLTEEVPDIVEEEEEEIVEFFAVQKKPKLIKRVAPKYPDIARKAGIEAMVVINFIVDEKGLPTNIKVIKGHPMLNEAAIEAIKKYKFEPGYQRDKPVKVKWQIPIRFRLSN